MFGFGKPIFSGSISDDNGNSADVELDGSGYYQESRKVWRFRQTNGDINANQNLSMNMQGRQRQVRIASRDGDSNYGYIELL